MTNVGISPVWEGPRVLGDSPNMRILEIASREVANSPLPVLIVGEPGTGKRFLGLRIHQISSKACGGLAEIESEQLLPEQCTMEAIRRQADAQASDGEPITTILLREIGTLDPRGQAILYQSLVDHIELAERDSQAPKLIFTSSKNLEQEVKLGHFREDLYYQISGVCLRMPPLRHRKKEIASLTEMFLANYAGLLHRPKPGISESTLRFLTEYHWPGNLRELEDAARTIAAVGDDKAALAVLRSAQRNGRRSNGRISVISLKEASRAASRAAEKELILKVLSRTHWNRKRAAEELKISYKALLYKLKRIGVNEPDILADRGMG